MARSKEKLSPTAGRRLRLARRRLSMTAEALMGWERWYQKDQYKVDGDRIVSHPTTISNWERKGIPENKVEHVAAAFGMAATYFTDEDLTDEEFKGILENRLRRLIGDPRPERIQEFESFLTDFHGQENCRELLEKKDFGPDFLLAYALMPLNPAHLRQLTIGLRLETAITEEELYRLAQADKICRMGISKYLRRLYEGGIQERKQLAEVASERLVSLLLDNIWAKLLPVADFLINEAKTVDIAVLDHAQRFRTGPRKMRIINAIIKHNGPGRLTRLDQHKIATYWKVRDRISGFVIGLIQNEAFFDDKEARQGRELLRWAIEKAEWHQPVTGDTSKKREYFQEWLVRMEAKLFLEKV